MSPRPPYRRWARCAVLLLSALSGLAGAEPALPRRDLRVELREADAGATSSTGAGVAGWSVRSTDARTARERPKQQVRVGNGASASFGLTIARRLQVWPAAPGVWQPPLAAPATEWIEAGQRLTVQPRWPGGRAPVAVALTADWSQLDPAVAPGSAELPQRGSARVATIISAPLGQWTTVAAAGGDDGSVVSSGQASAARVLQLRVSLLP